jgi:glycine hydroxymethyltransferase
MHVVAAKAVCFGEALTAGFKEYQREILENARALASGLIERGYRLVSGGTDCHLVLLDLREKPVTGKEAEAALESAGITANKNAVPGDTRPPTVTSGLRLGTPALTTRGMRASEMKRIAAWIADVLDAPADAARINRIRGEIRELAAAFPLHNPRAGE